jgi:hypothetical protein
VNQWLPNGYVAYEDTVQTGSVVHEMVWTVAGYPGNWYWYFKSVKFNLTGSSYRFGSVSARPSSAEAAGYHNG